ncbi:hypothetical protein HAZT_HAZT011805 [Hyalella azteca]|uniref:Uncharacterized protein n=1 Tax=Hyalella azteca TaxID=294128 RepID=A0A6A0GTX0_HYAAZ|nr:hypothetical protein HAZT_HAZT011805 [Hyalella azteca]
MSDWNEFTLETERVFRTADLPPDVSAAEKLLRQKVLNASKHNIPSGSHITSKPGLSKEITDLMRQRDTLRSTNPSSPNIANMTARINRLTNNLKTTRWKEYLDTFNRHTNVKRLWSTIKAPKRKT